ncbi:glutathione S-transferase family protein [Ramlibacter rhizophilus]|uniref:Glutathione S-transferase family protein n=1 Tax=Ramlibacter rhizophilus TaxID=1781167 RepID=A0A4Z0BF83_9BURK|nr:glutathione S-transferase family protein [Ramlibacter rhizophilus]TFY97341.1 glutathione S-transferase family protein [Ramlibacter rhizophilus]
MSVGMTMHHIPVCPFSQRVEILLALKEATSAVQFEVVDITRPRSPELLAKTRGTTALPVLEFADGRILKESLVIMQYLEDVLPGRPVAQPDPWRRAVENMLVRMEGDFVNAGYTLVMNQDPSRRDALHERMLAQFAKLDAFLREHAPEGPFLFEEFGWAEAVFTPMFMRFWFLSYYEDFELPQDGAYDRVCAWRQACLAHPAAQQVTREEIVKLYYDYAQGAGNGALLPGRERSSFVFEPHWRERPWPPKDKYRGTASDAALGLVP